MNSKTLFCNNKKCQPLDKRIENMIRQDFIGRMRFTNFREFPAQQLRPNNLHPNYLIKIEKTYKHDFFLFLTKIENKTYNIFVHKNNFYSVDFHFDDDLYKGTILKGDMVKNKNDCWLFYINDIIFYKNNNRIHFDKLSTKLKVISNIIKEEYEHSDDINACVIKLDSFFTYDYIKFINKKCRIIFYPEYTFSRNQKTPRYFFDINIETSKPIKISDGTERKFKIRKTDKIDVYELYDIRSNIFDSIACVNKLKTSMKLRKIFEKSNNITITTKYSEYFSSWVPVV